MKKVCEDCHKSFDAHDKQQVRCPECQEAYRKEFQKEYQKEWQKDNPQYHKTYWTDKPNAAAGGQYYQFWRFCTTLTDDERRALVSARIRDLKQETTDGEWRRLRTEIKILCQTYEGEKIEVYEMRNKERERLEQVKRGVEDE